MAGGVSGEAVAMLLAFILIGYFYVRFNADFFERKYEQLIGGAAATPSVQITATPMLATPAAGASPSPDIIIVPYGGDNE